MGVTFTEDEAIFLLLHRLPKSTEWLVPVYKRLSTIGQYNKPASTTSESSPASTITFTEVVTSLSEEVNRLQGERKLARPGSEYANPVTHNSSSSTERKVNPTTGVRIHKQST